jgi:hypothetical protein
MPLTQSPRSAMSRIDDALDVCRRRGVPGRIRNGETCESTISGKLRIRGRRLAYEWPDLPFRAADAYRHNRKVIGACCWLGHGLARCCSGTAEVAGRSVCMCAIIF